MGFGRLRPRSMVLDEPENTQNLFRFDSISVRRIALDFKEQKVPLQDIPSTLPRDRITSNGVKGLATIPPKRNSRIVSMPEFLSSAKQSLAATAIAPSTIPKSEKRRSRWFSKSLLQGGSNDDDSNPKFDALPYQNTDPNTIKPVKENIPWTTLMEQRAKTLHLDKELPSLNIDSDKNNNKNIQEDSTGYVSESSIPPRRRPLWHAFPSGRDHPTNDDDKVDSNQGNIPTKLWECPPTESTVSSTHLTSTLPNTSVGSRETLQLYNASKASTLKIQEPYYPNPNIDDDYDMDKSLPSIHDMDKSLPSIHDLMLSKSSNIRQEPELKSLPKTRHFPVNHPYRLSHNNVNSGAATGRRYASAPQPGPSILKNSNPLKSTPLNSNHLDSKPLPSIQPIPEKKLPPIQKELPSVSLHIKELPAVVGIPLSTKQKKSPFSQRDKVVSSMIPSLGHNPEISAPLFDEDKFDPLPSPKGEYFYETMHSTNNRRDHSLSPKKLKHIIIDGDDDEALEGIFSTESPEFIPLSDHEEDDIIPSYLLFINNAFGAADSSVREVTPVPDYIEVMNNNVNDATITTTTSHRKQLSNDSKTPNYVTYARSNDQSSFSDDSLFSDHNDRLDLTPPKQPFLKSAIRERKSNHSNSVKNRDSMISTSSSASGISFKEAKKAMTLEIAKQEFIYPLDTNRNYDDYTRFIYPKDPKRCVSSVVPEQRIMP
ncbi:uncharacterized protein KQ657_000024 [Scheffersomyces spartinae]|uniref:Uncharacterized protein n=1 Tax=Scheffersomyces spartinae TaxID=45513 RepID=A0A9P7VE60_9ASCO|nr:uncharacterized protein KQ657_000024 [Scheffersomyces spartinae]KAG7196017.1 hypothetical protein KQ657_000024 [Scheffersomyces spartinae]